jgi:hypothetical protein
MLALIVERFFRPPSEKGAEDTLGFSELVFARAVTRSDRQCVSWRPTDDEQEAVDQVGRDILRRPVGR